MRQILDWLEAEEARTALEGMKRAEDHIQGVGAGGIFFQHQNTLLNVLQQVFAFVAKLIEQLGVFAQLHGHGWFLRCGRIRRGQPVLAGFVQAFVPFLQHLSRISCKRAARSSHSLGKLGGSGNLRGNCGRQRRANKFFQLRQNFGNCGKAGCTARFHKCQLSGYLLQ